MRKLLYPTIVYYVQTPEFNESELYISLSKYLDLKDFQKILFQVENVLELHNE